MNSKERYTMVKGVLRSSGFDFFPTPRCAVDTILDTFILEGTILEPASGDGAISKVLEEAGYNVVSQDLQDNDMVYGDRGVNFLESTKKI